jgi:hypothetical protein
MEGYLLMEVTGSRYRSHEADSTSAAVQGSQHAHPPVM